VESDEIRVGRGQFGCVDGAESAIEGIDGLNKVAGEVLESKVLSGLDLALSALLEVAVVGDGAEVFVLSLRG
jgi:hypothetical protein